MEPDRNNSIKCLNCGHECHGKYCPECGQATSTARTTWKSFSIASIADMLRFKGPFLYTCQQLLIRPWKVIADYTAGRRVGYTSPLLLLLTLGIYSALLRTWLLGFKIEDYDETVMYLRIFNFSFGMGTFLLLPPLILAVRIVYKNSNIKRYNIPEILTAGIYLLAYSFLIEILTIPLDLVWGKAGILIRNFMTLAMCSICLSKAAGIRNLGKAIVLFAVFLILSGILLIIYMAIVELILEVSFVWSGSIFSD